MLRLISSSSKSKSSKTLASFSIPIHFPNPHHLSGSSANSTKIPPLNRYLNRFSSHGFARNPANFADFNQNWSGLRNFSCESSSSVRRETLNYDVVIVGAGPAGLSAAIRLKQLCRENDVDFSVCVVEKGAEVGAHILSGNVFEPRALNELLPNWKQEDAPVHVPVSSDKFWLLSETRAFPFPSPFNNHGNYVIRIMKYFLEGPKSGKTELVANLPGFPDNVRVNERGEFWVAIDCCRTAAQEVFVRNPWLRSVYFRLPVPMRYLARFAGMRMYTMIALLNDKGDILDVLDDKNGDVMKLVSEVREVNGRLWIGTVAHNHIATLPYDPPLLQQGY